MEQWEERKEAKTLDETDRKCPQCGGIMSYDAAANGLYCPYCEYREDIVQNASDSGSAVEQDLFGEIPTESYDWGTDTKVVICEACGAESVYDVLQFSDVCPYCGSNHVMKASDDVKTLAPGGVVPFAITREKAGEKFHNWLKRNWFCPKAAKESAKAEALNGLYLPYWTYDCDSDSVYQAYYGRTRTVVRNGKTSTQITWHPCSGRVQHFHNDVPVCATKRYNLSMLQGLEPFDTENNAAYRPEYIAGYVAERYSVSLQDGWNLAQPKILNQVKQSVTQDVQKRFGTSQVRIEKVAPNLSNVKYKYLMLPIWMSNFQFKGKIYNFMVNGQTGKVSGKAPVSPFKVVLTVLLALAALFLIAYASGCIEF